MKSKLRQGGGLYWSGFLRIFSTATASGAGKSCFRKKTHIKMIELSLLEALTKCWSGFMSSDF